MVFNERYWARIDRWKNITLEEFISHQWQATLEKFLGEVVPETFLSSKNSRLAHITTKAEFIQDAVKGRKGAPMNVTITPHILSLIDWSNPVDDPIRRQFIPSESGTLTDHPKLAFDSLHEEVDSPVSGLVHRYPGRALFLATSICPVYCRFCTRAWAVGGDTETVSKKPKKPILRRWEQMFSYIENNKELHDIVVSGGDCYYLEADQIAFIGKRLLEIPHIQRIRFASKGLAVSPGRITDASDPWTKQLIALSQAGRRIGKQVCLHTHFNHPKEITWITKQAADFLFSAGVIVRNQSVLLRGVNDNIETMTELISKLASINIQPYYVYQGDMVHGVEDLRTPLRTILDLEKHIRGNISGFMMPSFVVDLPGGGGKRLASTYDSYNETTGVSTWTAPGLPGDKGKRVYTYYDPRPLND
ncbi:kama family protein [Periconia macrospinosa]|uniref:Kama family protein n=1 Tax=Periconia macrospinosa TaxID=97972 RepID=A0A2V1DL96_9PLEO|nr:kama family protein [Periconia macrospinosa]